MFEAQDIDVIAKLLGSSDIQLEEIEVTPFDCFVLDYCMSHSNCTWKIVLPDCGVGDEEVELLVQGAVEEETHCTGGISEMNLDENSITSKGVKYLLNIPKQLINKVETFTLRQNKLDSKSCATLAHLTPDIYLI